MTQTATIKPEEIKLDALVESFTFSFGRVHELITGGIGVKYPQREELVYYSFEDIRKGVITIHKD